MNNIRWRSNGNQVLFWYRSLSMTCLKVFEINPAFRLECPEPWSGIQIIENTASSFSSYLKLVLHFVDYKLLVKFEWVSAEHAFDEHFNFKFCCLSCYNSYDERVAIVILEYLIRDLLSINNSATNDFKSIFLRGWPKILWSHKIQVDL